APTVLLTAAAVLFIAQNREDAALSMLWTTITAPLWLVLSAVFAVGFLAGFLVVRRRTRAARG
ncbi:MAG: DUF1049 domain-containing protein, partial [Cellulomonadaceae bacterium]|nr:DUF1049 domain-containing protein [Cellulomonadaceae bacterium]